MKLAMTHRVLGILIGMGLGCTSVTLAAPVYKRVEVGGVAQVLRLASGGSKSGRICYHQGHDRIYAWYDIGSGARTYYWLDPTRTGNLGGTHDSMTGRARFWSSTLDMYAGTVSGNVKTTSGSTGWGFAYLPDDNSILVKCGNGNSSAIEEFQAARSVSGSDVLTEGTYADQTLTCRLRSSSDPKLTTGDNHQGLALSGVDANYYYLLFVDNRDSVNQEFCRFQLAKAYSTPPTATTAGTRALTGLSEPNVPKATVNGLVPDYNDYFKDLANDGEGRIWGLSALNGTNFLTAFTLSLDGTLTQIDLDPDDDNGAGSMYVNLSGLITQADGTTAVDAHGLAVNTDASLIYIMADGGVSAMDSVFVFKNTRPDVQSLEAVNVGENDADLVGYLAAESGAVTCYWGTNDSGTVAANWDTATPMGTHSAPYYLTNSVSGLQKGTRYYFRYFATNTAGDFWATNTISFVTEGVDPTVLVGNDAGATTITATSALLRGEVLGGAPEPHVWIYWGTSEGTTNNKASWNGTPLNVGTQALGPFSQQVTGLTANREYWYRCYASNVNEDAWAPAATNFTTLGPSLSIDSVGVTEGAGGTTTSAIFTVTLSSASFVEVKVDYTTTDNTATVSDGDYDAVSGTLIIPAGNLSGTITVTVHGDDRIEYGGESFYVDLSNPTAATVAASRGTGAIADEDRNYYVRHGGAGLQNGQNWANAFAQVQDALNALNANTAGTRWIVRVEASAGGQSYAPATREFALGHLYVDFEGGWENVDSTPVQNGYSTIRDTVEPIDERGFNIESGTSSHNRAKSIGIRRFRIADVTDGIRIYNPNNLQGSTTYLEAEDCEVVAVSNGVEVTYHNQGTCSLQARNLTVSAGQGGLGHGVLLWGDGHGTRIESSRITSAGGSGFVIKSHPTTINSWAISQSFSVFDSAFTNCLADGIRHEAASELPRGGTASLSLDRVMLTGNGGHGVFMQQDARTGTGYTAPAMVLLMTNVVASGNGGCGVYLDGVIDEQAARFALTMANCTVANNGSNGVYGVSSENSGSSVVARNTIISGHAFDGIAVADLSLGGPALTESYNDFHGNAGQDLVRTGTDGTTYPSLDGSDLTDNPGFVGTAPEPYRLAAGSPLLDAGSMTYAPAVDIIGVARPFKAGPSIGAYETAAPGPTGTLMIVR